jgi:hypothetical protein
VAMASEKLQQPHYDEDYMGLFVPMTQELARAMSEGAYRTKLSAAEYLRRALWCRLEADGVNVDSYYDQAT